MPILFHFDFHIVDSEKLIPKDVRLMNQVYLMHVRRL